MAENENENEQSGESAAPVAHVSDLIRAHKRAAQLVASLERLSATNSMHYDHIRKRAVDVRNALAQYLDALGHEAGLPGW